MEIDKNYFDVLERAENELGTDYDIRWLDRSKTKAQIDKENILSMIEDLLNKIEELKTEYNDLEQDLQDNYKPIPVVEQYDISKDDFI